MILKTINLKMRDPFILYEPNNESYYIYGTTFADSVGIVEPSFSVYKTSDFMNFEDGIICFEPPKGFWGVRNYWAPEVYKIKDMYYMLASFKGGIKESRGCSFLISQSPEGPFVPYSEDLTTKNVECLDATYFNDGVADYIAYCEEWTQLYYGRIVVKQLYDDLKKSGNDSLVVIDTEKIDFISPFHDPRNKTTGFLTDAPFFHSTKSGRLFMLWSSYSKINKTYCVMKVEFMDGIINDNFVVLGEYLIDNDIGHPSIFEDKEKNVWLVAHNNDRDHGSEHVVMVQLDDRDDLVLKKNKE